MGPVMVIVTETAEQSLQPVQTVHPEHAVQLEQMPVQGPEHALQELLHAVQQLHSAKQGGFPSATRAEMSTMGATPTVFRRDSISVFLRMRLVMRTCEPSRRACPRWTGASPDPFYREKEGGGGSPPPGRLSSS